MAEDLRVPCELPADGEIKVTDLGPDGIYSDCKIDWDKQPQPHFFVGYSDDVKFTKDEPKPAPPAVLTVTPFDIDLPKPAAPVLVPVVSVPSEPVKTLATVGTPDHLPVKKSDLAHKASDPAATAAIAGAVAAMASNAAMSAVMKSPQVKKVLEQANKVLHKISKGKLGKQSDGKQEEKKEEQGGDCKTHQIQCNASSAALKAQIASIEARLPSDSGVLVTDGPNLSESIEELVERIEKLEKAAKPKKTTKTKKT